MKTYKVDLFRVSYGHASLYVLAETPGEAERISEAKVKANDPELEFSEYSPANTKAVANEIVPPKGCHVKSATYVSVWDGGERKIHTPCVVDTKARTVDIPELDKDDGEDVGTLDEEYVLLDGKKYAVALYEERGNYSAKEEAKMFFYG